MNILQKPSRAQVQRFSKSPETNQRGNGNKTSKVSMHSKSDDFASLATRTRVPVDARSPLAYNSKESGLGMNAKELTLRIVSLSDVLLHEEVETRRVERLIASLRNDWLLKNPPIVTQFDGKYIVLDGATRTTALERIHCRDIVVQVIDPNAPGMALESWNHLLLDLPERQLFDSLKQVPGLIIEAATVDSAAAALARRESIASIALGDGRVFSLFGGDSSLVKQAKLLNRVVAAYEGRGEMYRVAHTDVERLLAEHGRLSALIIFPRFRPDEIRELAINRGKLPMGITRHIIPGRALRINIPLAILDRDEPLEQKNAWLDRWMEQRMLERHVRYYQEPVFLFDE